MSSKTALARADIQALKAYKSARSLTTKGRVFLDANESPLESPIESTADSHHQLNRYPMPQPPELVAQLCQQYGVLAEQMLVGRGSDEAIDIIIRSFCEARQDSILITPPTYGMYEISAQIQGASLLRVPLVKAPRTFRLDADAIIQTALDHSSCKLIFICSPNNPTGQAFEPETISKICQAVRGRAMVIVDEAYAEFSNTESMARRLDRHENLIVLRTLSKAWAMAGLRLGAALGDAEVIELLQKVRAPYPIPRTIADLALARLVDQSGLKKRVAETRKERERLSAELSDVQGVEEIYSSDGNFILVRVKNEALFMSVASEDGIILRSRATEFGLQNCIRITVGTPAENDEVIRAFKKAGAR